MVATFYSSWSLYVPFPAHCPCCHIPRNRITFTTVPKNIKSPSGSSGVFIPLFSVSSAYLALITSCQSLRTSWAAFPLSRKIFITLFKIFRLVSIYFLFLWNFPFEFTGTRLFLGSACIAFPLLLSTTGCRTESHSRQDCLMAPPGLSQTPPQHMNPSTHSIPPLLHPSHKAASLGSLFHFSLGNSQKEKSVPFS